MLRTFYLRHVCSLSVIIILAVLSIGTPKHILAIENAKSEITPGSFHIDAGEKNKRPVLTVTPRELDLGEIGPGQAREGSFVLKNVGDGFLDWSTNGPENWQIFEGKKISTVLENKHANLRIYFKVLGQEEIGSGNRENRFTYPVVFIVQNKKSAIVSRKNLKPGLHREVIRIESTGGNRSLFVRFRIIQQESEPMLMLEPTRIDFGALLPGQQVSRLVKLENWGRNTLKWRAGFETIVEGEKNDDFKMWRYVSFQNEEREGKGSYVPSGRLKDVLEVSGRWSEDDGYPVADSAGLSMQFRFRGTFIDVFFRKITERAQWTAFIDDRPAELDSKTLMTGEKATVRFTGGTDGQHILAFVFQDGTVSIEGVKIYGSHIIRHGHSWITVFPTNGTTISEKDYINITASAQALPPGYYTELLMFRSNGGEQSVELSLEVLADNHLKMVDVYRYNRKTDYLYTSNPQAEPLIAKGYIKEGIAFHLYHSEAPGTTPFYRWYNPQRDDHYYSYDRDGAGKAMEGYVFEGIIGNIATSKLSGSRELYRWYHPFKKCHFYTTDRNGEGRAKNGYRFEGIAGYVK
ncbi:MAG: hypothetical protein JW950_12045 [Deltaproteobacteria bacterium]|nr:hypothetical protein [Deltaproteobacteria bacterium]